MELIQRLELVKSAFDEGDAEWEIIQETIAYLTRHKEAIQVANAMLQTARPLVLNMMRMEDAAKASK